MNNQLANVTESAFLPVNYEVPTSSRYMKFEDGANDFRVLGSAIVGYEYWKTNKDGSRKPVRVRPNVNIPISELEENPQTGELEMPRHFWAFPVWNYKDQRVQILHITQKSIQRSMLTYIKSPKWGDPKGYDYTVIRLNIGGKTSYDVKVSPPSPVPQDAVEEYDQTYINLEALYEGADPFTQKITHEDVNEPEAIDTDVLVDEVDQGMQQETQAKAQARTVAQKYRR